MECLKAVKNGAAVTEKVGSVVAAVCNMKVVVAVGTVEVQADVTLTVVAVMAVLTNLDLNQDGHQVPTLNVMGVFVSNSRMGSTSTKIVR
jgi:hypothetical protein